MALDAIECRKLNEVIFWQEAVPVLRTKVLSKLVNFYTLATL